MNYQNIGTIFRNIRLQHRASIRQFAGLLGIHHSTLHRYEQGRKGPSQPILKRLMLIAKVDSIEGLVKKALG